MERIETKRNGTEWNETDRSTLTKHINKCTLATVKYLTIYTYIHIHTYTIKYLM